MSILLIMSKNIRRTSLRSLRHLKHHVHPVWKESCTHPCDPSASCNHPCGASSSCPSCWSRLKVSDGHPYDPYGISNIMFILSKKNPAHIPANLRHNAIIPAVRRHHVDPVHHV